MPDDKIELPSAEWIKGLVELTRQALQRIDSTGAITRGDAAILSSWDTLWSALDMADKWSIQV